MAAYHASLGNVLAAQANLDDAAQCYRTVIEIEPANLEAHNNLGNVLKRQGRGDEAVAFSAPLSACARTSPRCILIWATHSWSAVCWRKRWLATAERST